MKKFALSAVAAATLGLAGVAIAAPLSLNLNDGTGAITYASELNYAAATGGGAAIGAPTFSTRLGFGVSASQNRYIRVDLAGAKLAADVASPANLPSVTTGAAFDNVVLVSGGATGDTFAIYQLTANTASGQASTDTVQLALPNVFVTNGNTAAVNVTYTLYETATAAVANVAGTNLYQKTGALLKFSPGLAFSLTPATNTAAVTESFKKFNPSTPTVGPVALGSFSYGTNAGIKAADGTTDVALSNLVTTATKIVFAGDFSAVATAPNGLFTGNSTCATPATDLTAALGTAKTSADFTVGQTATTAANSTLCYKVNGTTAIPAQTITAALDLTAATGTTSADVAAATVGTIARDGTTLSTPYANINSAYVNRFVFTNSGTAPAAYTAVVTTESGVTCTTGTLSGSLAAGTTVIDASTLVSGCTGAPRFSVTFNIAAPRQTIEGVYTSADKMSNAAVSVIRLTGPVSVVGTN